MSSGSAWWLPDDKNNDEMAPRNQDRNYVGLDNPVSEAELEADKLGQSLNFKFIYLKVRTWCYLSSPEKNQKWLSNRSKLIHNREDAIFFGGGGISLSNSLKPQTKNGSSLCQRKMM